MNFAKGHLLLNPNDKIPISNQIQNPNVKNKYK